jgi:hypothetical protein
MLPPEVTAELAQLLQALQSPNNATRSQAEEHLQNNYTNTRPEVLLMGLAEQIASSPDTSVWSLTDPSASLPMLTRNRTPDPLLCCPHLSAHLLQDAKDAFLGDDRSLHLTQQGSSCCDPSEAVGDAHVRVGATRSQ